MATAGSNSFARLSVSASSVTLGLSEPATPAPVSWKVHALKWAKIAFKAFKYTWSLALLVFALVLILWGIGIGTTAFYAGSPVWLNYILFVVFIGALGVLEGTMISLSQLRKAPPSTYSTGYKYTLMNTRLAFRPEALERFLMGRQICVIILVFVLARLTTVEYIPGFEGWLTTAFLQTGLFGAFIVLILGNLVPQILAAKFSVLFLNFIFINGVIRFCLFVRWTGLPHACWLCARSLAAIVGLNFDTGTAKSSKKKPEQAAPGDEEAGVKASAAAPEAAAGTGAGADEEATPSSEPGTAAAGNGEAAAAAVATVPEADADLDDLGASMLPAVLGERERDGHGDYVRSHLLDVSVKTVLPRRPVPLRTMPAEVDRALQLNSDRQLAVHESDVTAKSRLFATADEVADIFRAAGEPVPAFLLARNAAEAEPAFIAALRLLAEYDRLVGEVEAKHVSAHDQAKPTPADLEAAAHKHDKDRLEHPNQRLAAALDPIVTQAQLDRVKAPL